MGGSTDDWGDFSGPSAEELLRQEYPDLMDKWKACQKKEEIFRAIWDQLENFTFIERFLKSNSYVHVFEKWIKAREEQIEAKEEYQFLEKLLRDY